MMFFLGTESHFPVFFSFLIRYFELYLGYCECYVLASDIYVHILLKTVDIFVLAHNKLVWIQTANVSLLTAQISLGCLQSVLCMCVLGITQRFVLSLYTDFALLLFGFFLFRKPTQSHPASVVALSLYYSDHKGQWFLFEVWLPCEVTEHSHPSRHLFLHQFLPPTFESPPGFSCFCLFSRIMIVFCSYLI